MTRTQEKIQATQMDVAVLGGLVLAAVVAAALVLTSPLWVHYGSPSTDEVRRASAQWFVDFSSGAWTVAGLFLGLVGALYLSTVFGSSRRVSRDDDATDRHAYVAVLAWMLGWLTCALLMVAAVGVMNGFLPLIQLLLLTFVAIVTFGVGVATYLGAPTFTDEDRRRSRRARKRKLRRLVHAIPRGGVPARGVAVGIAVMTTAVAGCACALRLIHPGWSFAFISDGTLVAASMSSTIAIYGSFVRSFMRRLLPGSVIPRVAAILTMAVIVVPFAAILIELGSRSALTALVVGAPAAIAMALVWIPVGRRNRRRWSKVAAWVPGPGLDELSRRAIVKAKRTASVEGGSVERKTPAGAQRSESSVRGS